MTSIGQTRGGTQREAFPERWERMTPAERAALFGGDTPEAEAAVADLVDFARRVAEHPETAVAAVEEDRCLLDRIRCQIEALDVEADRLAVERLVVCLRLLLAGERPAQVAPRAGVTPMTVGYWSGLPRSDRTAKAQVARARRDNPSARRRSA